jgi:hypothetical protein
MRSPELCNPRTADSRPAPGPLRLTSTSLIPTDIAAFAASCAATVAANAEDFLDPEKFTLPADAHEMTLPERSVMATVVLLNVALTCAMPLGTVRCVFLRVLATVFLTTFFCISCLAKIQTPYFFLLATVLRLPLRVREFDRVRCPLTGRPKRWRIPR